MDTNHSLTAHLIPKVEARWLPPILLYYEDYLAFDHAMDVSLAQLEEKYPSKLPNQRPSVRRFSSNL